MPRSRSQEKAVFISASQTFPRMVREFFVQDDELVRRFGLNSETLLNFREVGTAFRQSELMQCIAFAEKHASRATSIKDVNDVEWRLTLSLSKKSPSIMLSLGTQILNVSQYLLVTRSKTARRKVFDNEARRLKLCRKSVEHWREVIDRGPLTTDSLSELVDVFRFSIAGVSDQIYEHLANAKISLDELVPQSAAYYERLVGVCSGERDFDVYAKEVLDPLVRGLVGNEGIEGAKAALLLGAHSFVATVLAEVLDTSTFDKLLRWAPSQDVFAITTLLETGLMWNRGLTFDRGAFNALLDELVIKKENEILDRFEIASSAFFMTYGELGLLQLHADKPPYWRRLAALAQAAIVARCTQGAPINIGSLLKWMQSIRAVEFSLLVYADLRTEQRWLANWAMPSQLRNELIGRILSVAAAYPDVAKQLGLYDRLLSDDDQSVKSDIVLLLSWFPGPLEGNIRAKSTVPAEIMARLREDLKSETPNVMSFSLLANTAHVFQIPPDIPELAADALRRAQHQLDDTETGNLGACLVALASLAAMSRNQRLADELFLVIRNYRRSFPSEMDLNLAFQIGLIACASREKLGDWCRAVGGVITDLAFGDLSREEAFSFNQHIAELCSLVPELWSTCGQAFAATEAAAHL